MDNADSRDSSALSPEDLNSYTEELRSERSIRNIRGVTLRYTAVLVAIAILATAIFWGSYEVTLQQTHDAAVLEVSGKQRTLRLRVEMLAERIVDEREPGARDRLTGELETVLEELEESHNVLAYGAVWNGPSFPRLPEAQSFIFGPKAYLDVQIREFINQAHRLLITEPGETERIAEAYEGLNAARTPALDQALDDIVEAYKRSSEVKIARMQAIQSVGLFLAVCLLGFSAFFVFRPMARRIKRDLTHLESLCASLRSMFSEAEMSRSLYEDLGAENAALAEEIEVVRRQAEQANRSKSAFLANMSHELRTPLNAILGFSQLLDSDGMNLTPDQKRYLQQVLDNGEHLLSLINDILDLARIEAGKMTAEIGDVSLVPVIESCMAMFEIDAAKKGVRLTVEQSPDSFPRCRADSRHTQQVLTNLVSNAIKYNRPDGEVTISISDAGDGKVRIAVTDTGHGIPAETHKQLFTPFERLGLDSKAIQGTGIGLTISKQLVEAMQGRIGVESEVGVGSTFWIELPVSTA